MCVGLADQPRDRRRGVPPARGCARAGAELAVATYDGQRANPVLLGRPLWPRPSRLHGDVGARALMAHHDVVEVDCSDTGAGGCRYARRPAAVAGRRAGMPTIQERDGRGPAMQITDKFHVDVPVEQAWDVLLDVERIAPCMPGAQLQEVEGDEYRGIVKVKVGPITAQYKGVGPDRRGRRGRAPDRHQGRGPRHRGARATPRRP